MHTIDHQQLNVQQVRFGRNLSSSALPKRTEIDLYCHRHPDKVIQSGCVALNCQKMLMCNSCNFDDRVHFEDHRDNIVDLPTFLEILASEIKKVNRKDSMYSRHPI